MYLLRVVEAEQERFKGKWKVRDGILKSNFHLFFHKSDILQG